jgi:hypothetical protein
MDGMGGGDLRLDGLFGALHWVHRLVLVERGVYRCLDGGFCQ